MIASKDTEQGANLEEGAQPELCRRRQSEARLAKEAQRWSMVETYRGRAGEVVRW